MTEDIFETIKRDNIPSNNVYAFASGHEFRNDDFLKMKVFYLL